MGAITFWGACGTVTGSACLLEVGGRRVLIDCGLRQGGDREGPEGFPCPPRDIHYVILTHAHLDHCGRLLELVRDGFRGEVLATHATAELLPLLLEDRLRLEPALGPRDLLERTLELCWGFEYDQVFDLAPGVRFRFRDAGHILGSASLEVWAEGRKIVFSGDLGRRGTPIIRDPQPIREADYVVMESTYGGRRHQPFSVIRRQLRRLVAAARREAARVFIPSFAIGRTQELIYFFNDLVESGQVDPLPVILDSPLALEVTRLYARHTELHDRETLRRLERGDRVFSFPLLFASSSRRASRRIEELEPPYVVIAGSGMVTGGRIVEHLVRHLGDRRTFVVFVGYQARGTPGRDILQKKPRVRLDHLSVPHRARVFRVEGFSAHADHGELLAWLSRFDPPPRRVFLVHGEPEARGALARDVRERLGLTVERPAPGRRFVF